MKIVYLVLFLLFLLILPTSCKSGKNELTKMSEDELYDAIVNRRNLEASDAVYRMDGNIITFDSIKKIPNLREDWTLDYYLNREKEIAEIVIRPATAKDNTFKRRLNEAVGKKSQQPAQLAEVAIDCENQTEILEQVLALDQEMRNSGNIDPEIDRQNLATVTSLIEQCGMPTAEEVGSSQMTAIWLVFQHADDHSRKKYFPLLQEAAAKGDLSKRQIAMMEDRILMNDGNPQRYGTQVVKDYDSDNFVLYDLEDPERVNKRRAEVGFGPLQDYLQNWNIVFNIEQVE